MTKPASLPKTNNDNSRAKSGPQLPANSEPAATADKQSPSEAQAVAKPGTISARPGVFSVKPGVSSEKPTKEELIAMVREMTERNGGRIPTRGEFHQLTGIHWRLPRRLFGSYRAMLEAAGCKARGPGWELNMAQLFTD